MRIQLYQKMYTYVMCTVLFLLAGMIFETANHRYADASYDSSAKTNSTVRPADSATMSATHAWLPIVALPPVMARTVESHTLTRTTEKNETAAAAAVVKYEATAFYLNVREDAHNAAKILHVVKRGTILEVNHITENGWLKLNAGGYVHGGYARLLGGDGKQSARVAALSVHSADVSGKPTVDAICDSGLTEDHISVIFKGTALADHGLEKAIVEAEKRFGINAYFTIAVMKLESGNGKSRLAKYKNNLFGLNAIDGDQYNKAFSFETKGDSVRKFGEIISVNYIDKGYTSIDKIARKYCDANPKWSGLVKNIMKSDYAKLYPQTAE